MQYVAVSVTIQFLLFCISNANPLIGNNIRRARDKEFPFIVSISSKNHRFDALSDHICTGTLLTRQHVLTAEHCMCSDIQLCQVMAGSINLYEGRKYNLSAWISYKQWIEMKHSQLEYAENDISIIKLEETITDPEVEPANLSTRLPNEIIGLTVIVAGWGRTNTQRLAIIMETAMLKVISKSKCLERVMKISQSNTHMVVPETVICSIANPYTLLDNGESGGPLLDTNNYVVGVNEGTTPITDQPFNPKEVNVHASVHYYRHFIMDVITNY